MENITAQSRRRILFVHIPKCAGTTVIRFLKAHYSQQETFITNGFYPLKSVEKFERLAETSRFSYKLIAGHEAFRLISVVHPMTAVVTVLREPVDRIISLYRFICRNPFHPLHDLIVNQKMELQTFVTSGISPAVRNWYTSYFSGFSIKHVESDPSNAVKIAIQNINMSFDLVGFQSNLRIFMEKLKQKAELRGDFCNEVYNASFPTVSFNRISSDIRWQIARVNHADVTLYNRLNEIWR